MPAWSVGGWSSAIPMVQTNAITVLSGQILVPDGTAAAPSLARSAASGTGFSFIASGANLSRGGNVDYSFGNQGNGFVTTRNDGGYTFSSTTIATGTVDVGISRNGAGIIEVNNGVLGTLRDLTLRTLLANGVNNTFGATALTVIAGGLGFDTITAAASAPGAAGGKIEWRCGTNAGTIKIVAYGGTSATGVTVVDNIGAGVTGC